MINMSLYYHGKVCDKHPELMGLRTKSRRVCYGCHLQLSSLINKNRRQVEREGRQHGINRSEEANVL